MKIYRIENLQELHVGHFNLLVVLSGNLTLQVGEEEHHVYKRNFLVYNQAVRITTASPFLEGYTITISKEWAEEMVQGGVMNPFHPYTMTETGHKRSLLTSLKQNSAKPSLSKSYVHILIDQLMEDAMPMDELENDQFRHFVSLIDENIENNFCAGEYAKMMDIPIKELIKTVRDAVDKTPCNVITERVVEKAKNKLAETNDSSKMIAYQLGFEDPYYFIKYFKKNTGLTPTQFRASH